jgi:spermidine synthase
VRTVLVFGLPAIVAYATVRRPQRFTLAVASILLAGQLHAGVHGASVHTARSFFAVHRVTQDSAGKMHRIVHGNTLHGRQWLDAERRCIALAYYHHSGPVGDIVRALSSEDRLRRAAVVGLGAGAMATYVGARQSWTFYEIDPEVAIIARNPALFTYLSHCAAGQVDVVLGDARLRLAEAQDGAFDLLAVDAFASDAIPVHLLTRQAFDGYMKKLAPGGLLAFHVSNRYLDLFGVLAAQARAAGLACRVRDDRRRGPVIEGVEPSRWVVMARQESYLGPLATDTLWARPPEPQAPAWTDDFSNLPGLLLHSLARSGHQM